MTAGNINTSYKTSISVAELEEFMLTGKIKPGFEGQVLHLIDETPTSMIVGAVDQLAAKKNIDAQVVWKNLAQVAAEIKSPNKFWEAVSDNPTLFKNKKYPYVVVDLGN